MFQKILHVNIIIIVTITYKRFFKYKEDITLSLLPFSTYALSTSSRDHYNYTWEKGKKKRI